MRLTRLLVAVWCACAVAARASQAQRPLRVFRWGGDAEGGAPFVEADPADAAKVRGFDVQIAELVARRLHREPRFVQVQWSSIEQSLERGDFELGLSGVEDRPELRARHAVSVPYFEFREVLAVRAADSGHYHHLSDLRGRRVGTLGATGAYTILLQAQHDLGVIPVSYDDDVHPYADLVAGRVDAVLLDHIIAERSLAKLGGFVIQHEPVATGYYVAIAAKRDTALRDSVDAVLRSAMRDGTLERIFRSWAVWDDAEQRHFTRVLTNGGSGRFGDEDARVAATSSGGGINTSAAAATTGPSAHGADAKRASTAAREYLPALVRAAGITLLVSCLAMTLAVTCGLAIAVGRVYGGPALRAALTVYVEVVRGTPVLLQLFVLYYGLSSVVRLSAFVAAILGLGLNYAAYESEIYRAALSGISRVQLEAARTLGFSEFQILRLIRAPQALRIALAPMTNDFVALLKDSSLVSVITLVELTKQTAIYAANVGSWVVPGLLCALIYLALSLPLSHLARRLEHRWTVS